MNRASLYKRMQELGQYSDFYYRRETGTLASVMEDNEILNCMLTGVNDGNRKLLAVTDSRLIIIFSGALGSGEVKVINRGAVTAYGYKKGLLPSAFIQIGAQRMDFTNTQRGIEKLFNWAMERPIASENARQ